MDADKIRVVRDKLTRVFRYLEALNQHRNPAKRQIRDQLWSMWFRDLPDHPSIRLGSPQMDSNSPRTDASSNGHIETVTENFVLKVQRPKLTRPPEPPDEVASWLISGWDDPSKDSCVHESRNEVTESGETIVLNFVADPARSLSFEQWKSHRNEWARNEKPARASMKIFETLYALHGRVEREAERVEIVLGDGILSWRRPEGGIHHPVLLQRLQLEFNASVPEFTLSEAEYPVELYSALFQSMSDVDGRTIGRCREELEQGGYRPLGDDATSGFLRRLVVSLSARGEFTKGSVPAGERDDPRIGRDGVVFLRARTLGFAAAIEGVLADLKNCEEPPWSLVNIVGEESPISVSQDEAAKSTQANAVETEVLLSRPANPEQVRIAKQLEDHGGVLVQGPPGTGKTHTIGNLIGHLLAQGKSVLVTSHTTKALRMVRRHIVPELRPLCVSVLESDLESRRQMESAVGSIAERLSRADAGSLETESKKLESQRRELLKKVADNVEKLTEARADEYRDIVVGGNAWAPSDAARKITREKRDHGWVPSPVAQRAPLPLSIGELSDLYRTNNSVSQEDETELSGHLPDLPDLLTPDEFEALVSDRLHLRQEDLGFRSDLWQSAILKGSQQEIETLVTKLRQAVVPLFGKEEWKLSAVYAGKYGGAHRQLWDQLLASIRLVHREAASAQETLLRYSPSLLDVSALEDQDRTAGEILAHLEKGGGLGWLTLATRRSWGQFIENTTVGGKRPFLPEHFHALRKISRLKILRRDLSGRWDRQVATQGSPSSNKMGEEIEKILIQFCDPIQDCLRWHESTWAPLESELKSLGFLWDKFMTEQPVVLGANGELVRIVKSVMLFLLPILAARSNRLRWQRVDDQLRGLNGRLSLASKHFNSSKVIAELGNAVAQFQTNVYRDGYARLLDLRGRRTDLHLRLELLKKLEIVAPAWAGAIRNRAGIHGQKEIPGDALAGWLWRQLNTELDRRASVSLQALQAQSENLREQLRRITVELIDKLAWSCQARRTSLRQRQALIGWLDTIRRLGKTGGIRGPQLRAEAARKMSECRTAVPVWVMPLSRVVENFDPRVTRFDVVIIDEASQSDVMALIALYLGKTALVVGDHEQVSPSAVGQDLGIIQNLIFQYLQGIPNSDLYDGRISIYDLARQSFGGTTCLVEHFRCVPEIIQFSNMISYEGRIKPLRDASRVRLRPHTVSYRVAGSSRDGKVNRQEAITVASLIAAALEQPEYQENEAGNPVSFGVVSLLGDEQAVEIDSLLRTHLSPEQYGRHRILCGNAAQFQGDERDAVFISLVDTAERGPLAIRDQQLFKQRFNVAASRARDQMWVIHSLNPQSDLKSGDLRRLLVEHAQDPSQSMRILEEKEKRTESEFERQVLKRLLTSGYRVTPQWRVGAYRIDLVVEGDGRRLAVECDGDRYHPLEKLADDMERQATLERMGWVFSRIRGTEFFRDPEQAIRPVFEKLQTLEIPAAGNVLKDHERPLEARGLVDQVIRRSEELRTAWTNSKSRDDA
jgi:very-short-patch-repair endonuclease